MQNFWALGAPPPDPCAAGALAQTPKTVALLRISGCAPDYNTSEFLRFVLKIFIIPSPPKFSGSATAYDLSKHWSQEPRN